MKYLIPFFVLALMACQPPQEAQYSPPPMPTPPPQKPTDPAPSAPSPTPANEKITDAEQAFFNQEQKAVETQFRQLGYTDSLKKIPIYLVSKSEMRDSGDCVNFSKIRINGKNMTADLANRKVVTGVFMSLTRITLLQELGHCYFKLQDSKTVLSKPGYKLAINGKSVHYIPQSILIDDQDLTRIQTELTRYFVGQILGLWEADSLEAVAYRVPGARVVAD